MFGHLSRKSITIYTQNFREKKQNKKHFYFNENVYVIVITFTHKRRLSNVYAIGVVFLDGISFLRLSRKQVIFVCRPVWLLSSVVYALCVELYNLNVPKDLIRILNMTIFWSYLQTLNFLDKLPCVEPTNVIERHLTKYAGFIVSVKNTKIDHGVLIKDLITQNLHYKQSIYKNK